MYRLLWGKRRLIECLHPSSAFKVKMVPSVKILSSFSIHKLVHLLPLLHVSSVSLSPLITVAFRQAHFPLILKNLFYNISPSQYYPTWLLFSLLKFLSSLHLHLLLLKSHPTTACCSHPSSPTITPKLPFREVTKGMPSANCKSLLQSSFWQISLKHPKILTPS